MPEGRPSFFPRSTPPEFLETLYALDDNQFRSLQSALSEPSPFDLDKDRCTELGSKLNLRAEDVAHLLGFLAAIYYRARDIDVDSVQLSAIAEELVDTVLSKPNSEKRAILIGRLTAILRNNEKADRARKLNRLKSGFLRNATSFSSILDFRPNFNEDRSAILELLPVVQFKVTTDSDDPSDTAIIFQMDEATLAKLKEAVDLAQKKLSVASSDPRLTSQLAGES